MKGVPHLSRIVYTRRLGGWTFGWSLRVLNFFEYLSVYYHHKLHPYHILVSHYCEIGKKGELIINRKEILCNLPFHFSIQVVIPSYLIALVVGPLVSQ